MNDRIVRQAFHSSILKSSHISEDTFVVDELGLKNGESRADIAVLNGKMIGYEIKTEKDNLNRLANQITSYNGVFDKIYLITDKKHLDKATDLIPSWWGIFLIEKQDVTNEITFKSLRSAKINKHKKTFDIAQLLWKQEACDLVNSLNVKVKKNLTKCDLYDLLTANYTPSHLGKIVLNCLKTREHWRINQKVLSRNDDCSLQPSTC